MTPFTHLVSLGNDCTTAFQLRGAFPDLFLPSAFDWLVTPFDSLLRILEDDGEQFGLSLRAAAGWNVECERYGVLHVHDFPKVEGGPFRFSVAAINEMREKMIFKHRRMIETATAGRPLFVRYRGFGGPMGESAGRVFGDGEAAALAEMLTRKLGHDRFVILLIAPTGRSAHYVFDAAVEFERPEFALRKIAINPDVDSFGLWPDFRAALASVVEAGGSGGASPPALSSAPYASPPG